MAAQLWGHQIPKGRSRPSYFSGSPSSGTGGHMPYLHMPRYTSAQNISLSFQKEKNEDEPKPWLFMLFMFTFHCGVHFIQWV